MRPGKVHLVVRGINPVPWKAPYNSGRKGHMYQDAALRDYKEALRETVEEMLPPDWIPYQKGPLIASFFFWRQIEEWEGPRKRVRNQDADLTNLIKSTEDALQTYNYRGNFARGVYKNDRLVQYHGMSGIRAQAPDVEPAIYVTIGEVGSGILTGLGSADEAIGLYQESPDGFFLQV